MPLSSVQKGPFLTEDDVCENIFVFLQELSKPVGRNLS